MATKTIVIADLDPEDLDMIENYLQGQGILYETED